MKLKRFNRSKDDRGAALLSSLLVMLLMAGVTAGFTALVITDTRVRQLDSSRTQSFYAVHAGLEKLTADLGDLFAANVAPTSAQINGIANTPPTTLGVTWTEPDGTDGYRVNFPTDAGGNPQATVMTVSNGPFQGLVGLATPYTMTATGRVADGSESSLTRTLQTVAIPVFQFGIFSENDLSFFAGPDFNFGGRVHSNSNVFLAEGNGNTLSLADRVTSVGEIIRTNLSNGWDTNTNYTGTVRAITTPGNFRALARSEGSLTGTLLSAQNEPTWTNLSTGTYNHNIMNSRTGARRLDLPITQFGAGPVGLIQRPVPGENITAPNVLSERFYTLASLRILLSDNSADITGLPGVTATAPVHLNVATPLGGYAVSNAAAQPRPPFGMSPAAGGGILVPQDTPLVGGWIKIEKQTVPGTWVDVTTEILSLGINSPQLYTDATGTMAYNNAAAGNIDCADLTPNAIIRIQRLWDAAGVGNCTALNNATNNPDVATAARRYSPLSLYDPREGVQRDTAPATMPLAGIMYYVELDTRNLARWFRGQIPAGNCPVACSGNDALNVNGYAVYFSDRRGNRDPGPNTETGEYGFEDIVNTGAAGAVNNALDPGEDFNGNGTLQVYGGTPRLPDGVAAFPVAPYTAAATPFTQVGAANTIAVARRNPAFFFRRALKVTRGANLAGAAPGLTGLTIASENPVYIQGDWNATGGNFNGVHVATAVLADAVTLLSNQWNDRNSFVNPFNMTNRNAVTTWYRLAIIAGKGISFPQPAGTAQDYGTDGGAHNFLRYIEDWSGQTLNYRGSIASLYFSRQATGTYKCCTVVYSPPTRGYNFDVEFLTPALLPPRTPMFRDVNITGFAQIIKP
ncbi:MAG: hypothetical protein ABI634_06675 [Acidobacteriota bacterium]